VKQPPRLATALVCRLIEHPESAVGDLIEQFQSGKSTLWFWYQVIGVIGQALIRDIQQNPLIAAAVLMGGVVVTVFEPLVTFAVLTFDEQLFAVGFKWFYLNGYRFPSVVLNRPWLITAALFALIAWTTGRLVGRRRSLVMIAFAAGVFVSGVIAPMAEMRISLTPLTYQFAFHWVSFDGYIASLTRHFSANGVVGIMNPLEFYVVILPLITLIAGLWGGRRTRVVVR
jgi:hypothetical protein